MKTEMKLTDNDSNFINMEFKGTKGTWQQSETTPNWIVSDIGGDILQISNHSGYDDLNEQDLANAKLIAQSHNLLNIVLDFIEATKADDENNFFHKMQGLNLYDRANYCIVKF